MTALKNPLLLQALKGESVSRPPIWIMRQAGRYLPEFRKLREKYSFFERCQNPELAAEITLQPVDKIGVDAAILFSDILVVPQAMGLEVQLIADKGPFLPAPLRCEEDLCRINIPDVEDRLHYVFEAITLTKKSLAGRVPLIGFAGAPWTLFCYMVQGQGSKNFDKAREILYKNPKFAHQIMDAIAKTTISYLEEQVRSGVDCVQLFDSWSGLLSPDMFEQFSLSYNQQIVDAISEKCPVILFAKGAWFGLEKMCQTKAAALGIDWCIRPEMARHMTQGKSTLQGNLDPAILLGTPATVKKKAREMIDAFGKDKYIANLGHGILPQTPVDNARAFVDSVKEYNL